MYTQNSNLRAVLQKMCNQINILMRKMKDVEDNNLDQISEMASMKTTFEKEKKQHWDEYGKKFDEVITKLNPSDHALSH